MGLSFDQLAVGLARLSLEVVMPIIAISWFFSSGFVVAFYGPQVLDQKASYIFRWFYQN